jgi:methylase of polypeptide subunit release factors
VLPADWLELMQRAEVIRPQDDGWRATVRASTLDGVLFFHSAYPTTSGDAVFFGPDTYRFTSAMKSHMAALRVVRRAVDIGSGAGPAAVLIARAHPDAEVIAADINDAALRFAAVNAALAAVANVTTRRSNLLHDVDGRFDLIVANPPYLLDKAERAYRHGGGNLGEGLSLEIVDQAADRLAAGGMLLLYTGTAVRLGVDEFRERVSARLEAAGLAWRYRELDPDIFGEELVEPAYAEADRIAAVLVTATKPSP